MSELDTTNRNAALASALTAELARCGVRTAVISPGSRSSPVALALERETEIATHVILDERVAGFFALGAALASGRPAVVSCTSGSAAANLHPAVVEADEAGVPLIALTSDRPPELRGIGAGQTIDQIKLYGSSVRWFCEIGTHEADDAGLLHYRASAVRAVAEAGSDDRAGPVHLNLAWRDPLGPEPREDEVTAQLQPALSGRDPHPLTRVSEAPRVAVQKQVSALADRVASAERPLLIAGRHPHHSLAAPLGQLAARASIPLLAEPTSQLRSGRHDRGRVIDAYDLIARARPAPLAPDLVLRFGDMPTSKPLRQWLASIEGLEEIVVDPSAHWHEPRRTATELIRCDGAGLATELAARVTPTVGSYADAWSRADASVGQAVDACLAERPGSEPSEPAVHRALPDAFADDELVMLASSMPVRDHEAFAPGVEASITYLCNRGANGIDGTVATAAGAAASSGRGTWVILGDLAVAHDLGGLAAIAECSGPFRLVVLNNSGGGIFEFLPVAGQLDRARLDRLFITPSPLELERVAALFDLDYVRVDAVEQLEELSARERVLAEVRTDRHANVELHAALAEAVAAALAT